MLVKCFGIVQAFTFGSAEPFDDDSSKNLVTSSGDNARSVVPPILQDA